MPFDTLPPFEPGSDGSRMEKFIIEGGRPFRDARPRGNKNAALPALAATLLTEEEIVLRNVPRIRDVEAMIDLLVAWEREAEWRDDNVVALRADKLTAPRSTPSSRSASAPPSCWRPLLARFGTATMPPPGGDVIGRRRLDPHLDAFRALGAEVRAERSFELRAPDGLHACDFFMDEASVMATENALMAAALTPGSTVIHNAASEPHVQDLARLLMQMGARIEGIGSNLLSSTGRRSWGRRLRDRPRPHRDRLVHRARGLHRRRAAHPRLRCRRPAHDEARVRAARLPDRVRRQ